MIPSSLRLRACSSSENERSDTPRRPGSKAQTGSGDRAVSAGWPAVEPVLAELVGWCFDGNWPVAHILAPFLASLGTEVAPVIRGVLDGDDDTAKYFVLCDIVGAMQPEGRAALVDRSNACASVRRVARSRKRSPIWCRTAQTARHLTPTRRGERSETPKMPSCRERTDFLSRLGQGGSFDRQS
jgi:Domain of unknown function (DUF5071)